MRCYIVRIITLCEKSTTLCGHNNLCIILCETVITLCKSYYTLCEKCITLCHKYYVMHKLLRYAALHPVMRRYTAMKTADYCDEDTELLRWTHRTTIIRKLANSKWGCRASTLRPSCLALCYSAAEYACPVLARSPHASKLNPAVHDCCRTISGCLKPTNLTPAGRHSPSSQQGNCCQLYEMQMTNKRRQTPTVQPSTSF